MPSVGRRRVGDALGVGAEATLGAAWSPCPARERVDAPVGLAVRRRQAPVPGATQVAAADGGRTRG